MRKVVGLILLAILWGRYLYAVEIPQVIWLYSSQTAKKIVINRFDSCLVSHGVETHHFPLHLNNINGKNVSDYLYNKVSLAVNIKRENHQVVDVDKTDYLRNVFQIIQNVKFEKEPKKGKYLSKAEFLFFTNSLARSFARFDSGQILQQMKCSIYAIFTNQDLSWDFLGYLLISFRDIKKG